MKKIAVIGGGISGLSIAQCLKDRFEVHVYEKESRPGGLIKCERIEGNLYHMVGGHVFNSRCQDVLNWFWRFFDKDKEFVKAKRNAVVSMADDRIVNYPIENHVYMLEEAMVKSFIKDIIRMIRKEKCMPDNFEEFLRGQFGETLYQNYFQPYNEKIWRKDLTKIPLSWLEGKLPMPTIEEMIYNNFNHVKEMNMVHSSFYYAKQNGSQFLADRLAEKLDIHYESDIKKIVKRGDKWDVDGTGYDKIIFCGNIKDFPELIGTSIHISSFVKPIEELEYHGTTSVLCEIDKNPYSWVYMPSRLHLSHRIICTGNFSETNSAPKKMTGTIEFTDYISKEDIDCNLKHIPFAPKYLAHHYAPCTYPIQNTDTNEMIRALKKITESNNIYFVRSFR